MEINTHRRIVVDERSQVFSVRQEARAAAAAAGLPEEDGWRAELVATELGTNLVKHARSGEVLVRAIGGVSAQVELIAVDKGPGIADLARAFEDGVSSGSSPGTGLGAIRRLSDVFDIYSTGAGTVILSRIAADRTPPAAAGFDVGGVSLPIGGEQVSGDLWRAVVAADTLTLIVADGLGHGVSAHEAALAVLEQADPSRGPGDMIDLAHRSARHTRGAAAAVAQVGASRGTIRYAGIGNVSALVRSANRQHQLVSVNGTLGHQVHAIREFSYDWARGSVLVMFSDGLSARWDLSRYPGLELRHPSVVAAVLYRDCSRRRDDVTVVVAREVA
jgi:anti-sigma regulatory factor (Ser/Thr protein kinase)